MRYFKKRRLSYAKAGSLLSAFLFSSVVFFSIPDFYERDKLQSDIDISYYLELERNRFLVHNFVNSNYIGSIEEKSALVDCIIAESSLYNVNPILIAAIIKVESRFNPKSLSKKGAIGLMQVMPFVGYDVSKTLGIEWNEDKLFEPNYNLRIGVFFLNELLKRFNNLETALIAYNHGPTYVSFKILNGEEVSTRYLDKIIKTIEEEILQE